MRWLFKYLRIKGDVRAARRGPSALGKRYARRAAHRQLSRWLRRL